MLCTPTLVTKCILACVCGLLWWPGQQLAFSGWSSVSFISINVYWRRRTLWSPVAWKRLRKCGRRKEPRCCRSWTANNSRCSRITNGWNRRSNRWSATSRCDYRFCIALSGFFPILLKLWNGQLCAILCCYINIWKRVWLGWCFDIRNFIGKDDVVNCRLSCVVVQVSISQSVRGLHFIFYKNCTGLKKNAFYKWIIITIIT